MVETFTSRQKKKKELAVRLVPFKPKRDERTKGRHMSLYVYFKLKTRSSVVSFLSYQQVREIKLILFADSI